MSGARGPRTRIVTGIFQDQYGYSVTWQDRGRQREKHFPLDTPIPTLKAFRKRQGSIATQAVTHERGGGSFVRDVVRYLRTRKGRPSHKADRSHLRPWVKRFKQRSRHAITREAIQLALADWADKSARELRHRVNVLRQVYRLLDGPTAPTPCDGVTLPTIPKTRPKGVPDGIIQTVGDRLYHQELAGTLRDGKTRARFLVQATCGKRPCQLVKARPIDVSLERRIWDVEPAKNASGGPQYLNDEMLEAWRLFITEHAWGKYDASSFAKTLRRNGWPAGVRPYNMRHQTLQAVTAAGGSLEDSQQMATHASPVTTQRHYVPLEVEKSKAASERIDGRFDPAMFKAREMRVSARALKAARKAARLEARLEATTATEARATPDAGSALRLPEKATRPAPTPKAKQGDILRESARGASGADRRHSVPSGAKSA